MASSPLILVEVESSPRNELKPKPTAPLSLSIRLRGFGPPKTIDHYQPKKMLMDANIQPATNLDWFPVDDDGCDFLRIECFWPYVIFIVSGNHNNHLKNRSLIEVYCLFGWCLIIIIMIIKSAQTSVERLVRLIMYLLKLNICNRCMIWRNFCIFR